MEEHSASYISIIVHEQLLFEGKGRQNVVFKKNVDYITLTLRKWSTVIPNVKTASACA